MNMHKKVLVIYYTQSGQLLEITKSVTSVLKDNPNVESTFEELRPKPPFPFPWTSDEFFQPFPESVKGIPCELEPLKVTEQANFDLVIIAWQPWYLSPSLPIHAFFQLPAAKVLLSGKPVITIIGSRNMWVMAQLVIRDYIKDCGGRLVGNIALCDRSPNLLSVISIMRWMFTGKRDRYLGVIPPAGVSQTDIENAGSLGHHINEALMTGAFDSLQEKLVANGAVNMKPGLVMIEKRGKAIFKIWAQLILKKGPYGSKARIRRLHAFKYYLLAVIYLASPVASFFFILTKPFREKAIQKQKSLYQSV